LFYQEKKIILNETISWREKEFIEKYKGFRHNTDNDNYSALKATLKNGLPIIMEYQTIPLISF